LLGRLRLALNREFVADLAKPPAAPDGHEDEERKAVEPPRN
jgi:hypothetical protein